MECNIAELVVETGSLYDHFMKMEDSRKKRGIRYSLPTLLLLIVLAKICGEDKPYGIADWVQCRKEMLLEALQLKYPRLPHHSTYERILENHEQAIDEAISEFLGKLPAVEQSQVITLDGKTARGTITEQDRFGVHLLAAYLPEAGIVLKQLPVAKEKENEIVVAPRLLESLNLEEKVVVGDAMQTQRGLSSQIVEAGGDYVWIAKDNQPKTREASELLFAPQKPVRGQGFLPMDFVSAQTTEKAHGRLEERTITWTGPVFSKSSNWNAVLPMPVLEKYITKFNMGSPV